MEVFLFDFSFLLLFFSGVQCGCVRVFFLVRLAPHVNMNLESMTLWERGWDLLEVYNF